MGVVGIPHAGTPFREKSEGAERGAEMTRGSEVETDRHRDPTLGERMAGELSNRSQPRLNWELGLTVHRQQTPNGTQVLIHRSLRHH